MSDLLADPLTATQRGLFMATVVLQAVALLGAARCRTRFDPGDAGRKIWTLITVFLGLRLLAEIRLSTLYFDLVPDAIMASQAAQTFYVVVLRYLYSVSDVVLVIALLATIRSYRGLGLHFRLERNDRAVLIAVASLPIIALALRQRLTGFLGADDRSILVYRLVAVTLASVTALLCVVILRYVRQMGGGALARVWGAVVVAGLARAGSFVVLAFVAAWSVPWGNVAEQALLLVFAIAWVVATRSQQRLGELASQK